MICDQRLNDAGQVAAGRFQLLFGFAASRAGDFQSWLVTHERGRQQRARRQRQSLRIATAKLTTARATSLPAASLIVTGTPTRPVCAQSVLSRRAVAGQRRFGAAQMLDGQAARGPGQPFRHADFDDHDRRRAARAR